MSAEISVLISTTLSKGTEVPRARSPAHSLTHSLTVHLFTHSSCSTLSGATRTRTCRCCSAAACRLVPRACPVARTSSRGLHRAALMHHFLSDACRVCLAGRYGHMPSDKTIATATPSPPSGQMPCDKATRRRRRRLRHLLLRDLLAHSTAYPLAHSPLVHSPVDHSPCQPLTHLLHVSLSSSVEQENAILRARVGQLEAEAAKVRV